MRCTSIVRSLYFRIFSASFLITFLSHEIATSVNIHVLFSLTRIIMSGLLLGIVLSVCTRWFHSMVTLPPLLVSNYFGTCSFQCFFWSNCTSVSLKMLKCSCALTLSCLFMYFYFAIIGHADIIWSIVSANCWQSYYYYYYYHHHYYYVLLHKIALSGPSDTALIYYYFSNTTCFIKPIITSCVFLIQKN
jgi:hypothetical protein